MALQKCKFAGRLRFLWDAAGCSSRVCEGRTICSMPMRTVQLSKSDQMRPVATEGGRCPCMCAQPEACSWTHRAAGMDGTGMQGGSHSCICHSVPVPAPEHINIKVPTHTTLGASRTNMV